VQAKGDLPQRVSTDHVVVENAEDNSRLWFEDFQVGS
jgi:hypothetical protein